MLSFRFQIFYNAVVGQTVFLCNVASVALAVGLGTDDLKGALALLDSRNQRVDP